MGKCLTVTFLLSGVALAGLVYYLYTPVHPQIGNFWTFQMDFARMKLGFLWVGLYPVLTGGSVIDGMRSTFAYLFYEPLQPADKAVLEIYDTKLNGVPVRVYNPKGAKQPLPGLVFYHGGGWVVLDVPTYDHVCAHIAAKSNIIVISVEYRLAPEHPFPAGFDDCVGVATYALTQGEKLGLDSKRIAVGGDSAGGNYAAAVAIKLRDNKLKPALKAQLIIYGVLQLCDFTLPMCQVQAKYAKDDIAAFSEFIGYYLNLTENQVKMIAEGKYLTSGLQRKCDSLVDYKLLPKELLPSNHVRPSRLATEVTDEVKLLNVMISDPRVAPLMEENLTGLPSALSVSVFWDFLRDEDLIYAERLKSAGNKVKSVYLSDSFHGILNSFTYGYDAGPVLMKEILDFIQTELK